MQIQPVQKIKGDEEKYIVFTLFFEIRLNFGCTSCDRSSPTIRLYIFSTIFFCSHLHTIAAPYTWTNRIYPHIITSSVCTLVVYIFLSFCFCVIFDRMTFRQIFIEPLTLFSTVFKLRACSAVWVVSLVLVQFALRIMYCVFSPKNWNKTNNKFSDFSFSSLLNFLFLFVFFCICKWAKEEILNDLRKVKRNEKLLFTAVFVKFGTPL